MIVDEFCKLYSECSVPHLLVGDPFIILL